MEERKEAERTEERILRLLEELRPGEDFAGSGDFFGEGLMDSLGLVSLVDALEEEFGVEIDPLDIVPERFSTLPAIAATVRRSGGKG